MLPSRSRLEGWSPESLTATGKAIVDAGNAVHNSVTSMSTNIATMPDTKAWSGDAHEAAVQMFERAEGETGTFSRGTTAIGDAFTKGADSIGGARTALLDKADEIDMSGQLHVSDQWVVLITGAQMTAEEAAALERRAQTEQITVNTLLLAVGAADDETAANVSSAATELGFEVPDPTGLDGMLAPGAERPADEVPNPSNPVGFLQQAMLRDADMSQTIRDIDEETHYNPDTGEEWYTTTTYHMQDGSKHVKTVNATSSFSDRSPAITEEYFDKDGNLISRSSSVTYEDWARDGMANAHVTYVEMANGTRVTLIERPNGSRSATVTTPGRPPADVRLDLFNHPILSTTGAAFSGLEEQADRGIPWLADEASDHIRVGAKYGGPAVGVTTALWDIAVADSGFERCVATAEGAASVTSGVLAGMATSGAGPGVAFAVALAASGGGQALGNWIGNTFCPR